jgi:drug/metabolite transporter (DMT)-like permease
MRNDLELIAAVLFWGFNVTVVKVGLRDFHPLAYNLVRFTCASVTLLLLTRRLEGSLRVERRDAARFIVLGLVGHALYQILFIEGIARTTVSSTSLLFGSSPVVIALLSLLAGGERLHLTGALGTLLAFLGVYFIVGGAAGGGAAGAAAPPPGRTGSILAGDLLVVGAVVCWAIYTVLARPLLRRYTPLRVTAVTLSIGTLFLIPVSLPSAFRQDWSGVGALAWAGIGYSFFFALVVSYVVWYRSVKTVGAVRTSVYSNLVPVFGTLFGVWLLGERLTAGLAAGAACILAGIVLTRVGPRST